MKIRGLAVGSWQSANEDKRVGSWQLAVGSRQLASEDKRVGSRQLAVGKRDPSREFGMTWVGAVVWSAKSIDCPLPTAHC